MRRYLSAGTIVAVLIGGACSSGSSKPAATGTSATTATAGTSAAGPTATSAPANSGGGALTVTGSLSLSLTQSTATHGHCTPGATGATGAAANMTGTLDFDNGTAFYGLQFSLGSGAATFPADAGKDFVAFYPSTDATKEWSIGTNVTSSQSGTASLSNGHGTVDVEMAPDPPSPNPSLQPIHVKGTFICP